MPPGLSFIPKRNLQPYRRYGDRDIGFCGHRGPHPGHGQSATMSGEYAAESLTEAESAFRAGLRGMGDLHTAGWTYRLIGPRIEGCMQMTEIITIEGGALFEVMRQYRHGRLGIGLPDLQFQIRAAAAALTAGIRLSTNNCRDALIGQEFLEVFHILDLAPAEGDQFVPGGDLHRAVEFLLLPAMHQGDLLRTADQIDLAGRTADDARPVFIAALRAILQLGIDPAHGFNRRVYLVRFFLEKREYIKHVSCIT